VATDIRFATRAEEDLNAIVDFLGAGSPLAERFAERFDRGIEQLLRFPESAPPDGFGARLLYLTGTSYSIAYEFTGSLVVILAVPHSSEPRGSWGV
jgi:plasmid stabilization system protein ParE